MSITLDFSNVSGQVSIEVSGGQFQLRQNEGLFVRGLALTNLYLTSSTLAFTADPAVFGGLEVGLIASGVPTLKANGFSGMIQVGSHVAPPQMLEPGGSIQLDGYS